MHVACPFSLPPTLTTPTTPTLQGRIIFSQQLSKLSDFLGNCYSNLSRHLINPEVIRLRVSNAVSKQISAMRLVCHDNSANLQHDGLMGLIASCPTGANAPTTTHPRVLLPTILPLPLQIRNHSEPSAVGLLRDHLGDQCETTLQPLRNHFKTRKGPLSTVCTLRLHH